MNSRDVRTAPNPVADGGLTGLRTVSVRSRKRTPSLLANSVGNRRRDLLVSASTDPQCIQYDPVRTEDLPVVPRIPDTKGQPEAPRGSVSPVCTLLRPRVRRAAQLVLFLHIASLGLSLRGLVAGRRTLCTVEISRLIFTATFGVVHLRSVRSSSILVESNRQ
jgi:hypothetical protein